jgi:hypothetical protein
LKRVRNRHDRLVGFERDEAAGVAHFSMYLPGTANRDGKRATVRATSYDEAVRLWSEFRSRAAEGLRRPSPEAPTYREFITDYFAAIETSLRDKDDEARNIESLRVRFWKFRCPMKLLSAYLHR